MSGGLHGCMGLAHAASTLWQRSVSMQKEHSQRRPVVRHDDLVNALHESVGKVRTGPEEDFSDREVVARLAKVQAEGGARRRAQSTSEERWVRSVHTHTHTQSSIHTHISETHTTTYIHIHDTDITQTTSPKSRTVTLNIITHTHANASALIDPQDLTLLPAPQTTQHLQCKPGR